MMKPENKHKSKIKIVSSRKSKENKGVVFIAMSGGVDSSVAALLLKQRGFGVIGVFMKNWTEKVPGLIYCPWEEDQRSARMAAAKIGIPFYTWNFEVEYKKIVFHNFIEGYQKGETPNPDVLCNKEIKFGLFLEKAKKLGADFIATGHYVKLKQNSSNRTAGFPIPAIGNQLYSRRDGSRKTGDRDRRVSENFSWKNSFSLSVAHDSNKDQSYFLWTLKQSQLRHCLFPLGDLTKPEVRKIAAKAGLPNAKRKDSQGLCFVGQVSLKDFLKPYIKEKPGKVVFVNFSKNKKLEEVIGKHQGIHLFTLGQRSGIGIGGGKPYFVCAKNKKENILYVCEKKDLVKFFPTHISIKNASWINRPVKFPIKCFVRYRYRQPLLRAVINSDVASRSPDSGRRGRKAFGVYVVFDKPPVAITPGQSIVFYKGKQMLGGGIIK